MGLGHITFRVMITLRVMTRFRVIITVRVTIGVTPRSAQVRIRGKPFLTHRCPGSHTHPCRITSIQGRVITVDQG